MCCAGLPRLVISSHDEQADRWTVGPDHAGAAGGHAAVVVGRVRPGTGESGAELVDTTGKIEGR